MLSGAVDWDCFETIPSLEARVLNEGGIALPSQCSHILPAYVNRGIDKDDAKVSPPVYHQQISAQQY